MACLEAYATTTEYAEFWGWYQHKIDLSDPDIVTALENQLKMGASDVNAALAQVAACDCSRPDWAAEWLKRLNILNTAITYRAPCGPRLGDDERRFWAGQLNDRLTAIREGTIDLCGGTGADYPAFGTVDNVWTGWQHADKLRDDT